MHKKLFLLLTAVIFNLSSFAQNQDSLTLVKARWQKVRVAKQLKLFSYHFTDKKLFNANEHISFLEVKNTGRKAVFALAAEEKLLLTTSVFAERDTAIAAINGNFFDVKDGGSVDYVKVNGKVKNTNRIAKNGARARHQQAAVVIAGGKLAIKKWDGMEDWESRLTAENVLLNGPLLTLNNKDEVLDTTSFTRLRHPRTAVGIKPNGRAILMVVDGRNENSAGMSLPELTKIMKWLGCIDIINFDGGGSSTLWVKGLTENGVVNYPTDNKKWDHDGQRKVANVVLIKQKR